MSRAKFAVMEGTLFTDKELASKMALRCVRRLWEEVETSFFGVDWSAGCNRLRWAIRHSSVRAFFVSVHGRDDNDGQ